MNLKSLPIRQFVGSHVILMLPFVAAHTAVMCFRPVQVVALPAMLATGSVWKVAMGISDSSRHFQIAVQQAESGDIEAAEQNYVEALRLQPSFAEAHDRLARLRASAGDFAGAVRSCSEVVRLSPGSSGAYANLGYMHMMDRQLTEAEANYRVALRLDPSSAPALSGLADILHVQGDIAAAEAGWRAARRLDKNLPLVHESLGALFGDQGRDREAIRSYRKAMKLEPSRASVHLKLAGLYHKLGKLGDAEKRYRAAIRLNPAEAEQFDTHKWLGLLLALRGAADEAAAVLEEAAELRKGSGRLPVTLVMNLADEREREFIAARNTEAKGFRAFCREAALQGHEVAAKLPQALRAVRQAENSPKWVAAYLAESLAIFGFEKNKLPPGSAYGAVWFAGFQEALRKAQQHLSCSRAQDNPVPDRVLVLGSAFGEQCLFAAALGLPCVGLDLLCNSTVQLGRRIVAKHDLAHWVDLHCGDAVAAAGLGSSSLVFINDYTWESASRIKMQQRLAKEIPKGAALVSFNLDTWDWEADEKLKLVETVQISVSWGHVEVQVRVKQ